MSPLLEQFLRWLGQLTLIDFILILWPLIIIDFLRSLIKATVLLSHALYLRLFKRKTPVIGFLPKVSIIIPAHNEEKVISRSIEAAIEAEYPNKEIVVVDDGSTDGTYRIALQYAKKGKIKLLHRDVASGSKAGALNYGLMFATGDIIITVDADTILERDAIKEAVKTLLEEGVSAVSGNVRVLS
ncbi:MAG: glycosyltransferase family 2 protein, partial [Candidatus Bathyarchaeia archaeon]